MPSKFLRVKSATVAGLPLLSIGVVAGRPPAWRRQPPSVPPHQAERT